jgi:hypothetical protein
MSEVYVTLVEWHIEVRIQSGWCALGTATLQEQEDNPDYTSSSDHSDSHLGEELINSSNPDVIGQINHPRTLFNKFFDITCFGDRTPTMHGKLLILDETPSREQWLLTPQP